MIRTTDPTNNRTQKVKRNALRQKLREMGITEYQGVNLSEIHDLEVLRGIRDGKSIKLKLNSAAEDQHAINIHQRGWKHVVGQWAKERALLESYDVIDHKEVDMTKLSQEELERINAQWCLYRTNMQL